MPQNKTQAFTYEDKTKKVIKFIYALRSGTTYKIFGLGVGTGGVVGAVWMWDSPTDVLDTPNNNESNAAVEDDVFFYYKGYIYMIAGGTTLRRFDATSAGAFNNSYQTISYTQGQWQAEPVHHSTDDCAYFFADNVVHRLNNVTWSGSVLTLPSNQYIVSACAYGNYLAIGAITKGTYDVKTIVYLWDRDSSLTTVSERIDFGEGKLKHLVNLDNQLIAIILAAENTFYNDRGKLLIKRANGSSSVILNSLTMYDDVSLTPSNGMYNSRVIKDNKLYFPAILPYDGAAQAGIWSVNSLGRISLEVVEEETSSSLQGIYLLANVWLIAHSGDGSTNASVSDGSYSTTNASIYESLIENGDDSSKKKKLIGVTVMTEYLPTAGQIVLKYKKDEDTSWTTIFTEATDNSISHSAINIESSGANLPEFKEIQFRIESTGGAVITALKYKWEEIDKDIY